jgi:recombination protein RecR
MYPQELLPLIAHLKQLPGVGSKTAERFAFELLSWPQENLASLGSILEHIRAKIPPCTTCGCLTDQGMCKFCHATRDPFQLCIIASPRDAFSMEATHAYKGRYHVIEHLLSPLDQRHTKTLRLDRIEQRLAGVQEIILAFDSTLEGDATALYLKSQLQEKVPTISRLAFGLPVGSNLESIDGGTLMRALRGRQMF